MIWLFIISKLKQPITEKKQEVLKTFISTFKWSQLYGLYWSVIEMKDTFLKIWWYFFVNKYILLGFFLEELQPLAHFRNTEMPVISLWSVCLYTGPCNVHQIDIIQFYAPGDSNKCKTSFRLDTAHEIFLCIQLMRSRYSWRPELCSFWCQNNTYQLLLYLLCSKCRYRGCVWSSCVLYTGLQKKSWEMEATLCTAKNNIQ